MVETDWMSLTIGGLAIALVIAAFLMMFTTVFTTRKR
jgi:hypothetical protein